MGTRTAPRAIERRGSSDLAHQGDAMRPGPTLREMYALSGQAQKRAGPAEVRACDTMCAWWGPQRRRRAVAGTTGPRGC